MAGQLAPGTWVLQSSDKFDDYLKALGVGMGTRLIVTKLKPNQEISVADDKWTIKTVSTFKTTESSFDVDQPFKETTPDGRNVEAKCTIDGNKLIRTEQGDFDTKTTRDFSQDEFKMTMECKGVTCTRIYKRATS